MGKKAPLGSIVTGFTLPSGYYDLEIKSLEEQYSREKGILMYVLEARVLAPAIARGKAYTERFIIGKTPWNVRPDMSDDEREWALHDDPEANDDLTWVNSRGARQLKRTLEAAQYHFDDVADMDVVASEVPGLKYGARIIEKVDDKPGSPYHGRPVNDTAQVYAVGRHEARVDEQPGQTARPGKRQAKPQASTPPRKPRSFSDYDEDDDTDE